MTSGSLGTWTMQESSGLSMEDLDLRWRKNKNAHLGEGEPQFCVTIHTANGETRTQDVPDPFITTTVVDKISRWEAFLWIFRSDEHRTIKTVVSVRGTHAASRRIMTMNPYQMATENSQYHEECKARVAAGGFLPGDSVMCAQAGSSSEDRPRDKRQTSSEV